MSTDIGVNLQNCSNGAVLGEARTHAVTIDRPMAKGGDDQGPMGGELLLLALGGCFLSTLNATAKQDGVEIGAGLVQLRVTGTLGSAPARFTAITVEVSTPQELHAALAKPLLKAERGCIVHNTLRTAMPIHFEYHVTV